MKRTIPIVVCALSVALGWACSDSPTAPSVWAPSLVREQLLITNLNHTIVGSRGRLTRWSVPIAVNTNNIQRAIDAVNHFEEWSGGVIRFTRVTSNPADGLVFMDGGAGDVESGCVNVTNLPAIDATTFAPRWDASSALVGAYTVHLGSDQCADQTKGRYDSAYAEHILAHALGIFDHFDGFTGPEGMVDAHAFAVVYNLYANPIGATVTDLVIWPGVVQ